MKLRKGLAADAAKLLERAIQLDPNATSAHYLLGQAYREMGKTNKAPGAEREYLRQVFTSFEFVLFKLCHIKYKDLAPDYTWECERSRGRFQGRRRDRS